MASFRGASLMMFVHVRPGALLPLLAMAALLLGACQQAQPSPTPAPAKPAAGVSPAASPLASPLASPSPAAVPSPAAAASPSPSPVAAGVVAAPKDTEISITAPAPNASVPAGDVRVSYEVKGVSLVPAAQATKLEDLHVHVLCDVDPAPYLATTTAIPVGRPDIIHTGELQAACPGMQPGQRKVTVILTGSNHVSVDPSVSSTVSFTVQ
jgi:hypothetical protein